MCVSLPTISQGTEGEPLIDISKKDTNIKNVSVPEYTELEEWNGMEYNHEGNE